MPVKSYAYAVGNVRAKETGLLKKQDLEQMMTLKTESAAANFLRDKGFGTANAEADVSEILKAETEKVWDYAASVAPDFSVFSALIVPNDYHNLKAVLKGTARARDYGNLLLAPSTVPVAVLEKAVQDKSFGELPEHMAQAARRAYDALIKTGDAQLSDGILDAACMKARLELAKASGLPMLKELVGQRVFYENFKVALRAARALKGADFLEDCLIDTDEVPKKRLMQAALEGVGSVLELMEKTAKYGSEQAAEAYRSSPSEYERFADDRIMAVARQGKRVTVGAEPLIGYLEARLAEIRAVRIVTNGIAAGASEEEIRGMLRELYD